MYPNLKIQMWKCGMRQNRLAKMLGIHETALSKIVNGFRKPDQGTRQRIAVILESDVAWLFKSTDDDVFYSQSTPLVNDERQDC
jgi:transcriptional regulator with XRE-family HTH domain